MMRSPSVWFLAALLVACSEDPAPRNLARFDRPTAFDFICVADGSVVKMSHCRGLGDGYFALHALVTQSTRGEVAAVDLLRHRVLDNRADVPGYTYVPVGELPIAIETPTGRPWATYVAAYGSRELRVLDTQALVSVTAHDPTLQIIRLPGAPTHMVLAPDEKALLISMQDIGKVAWLPIQQCASAELSCEGRIIEASIALIDLAGSKDRLANATPSDAAPSVYQQLCDFERTTLPATAQIDPPDPAMLPAPRPSGLAVDAFCEGSASCTRRVLIADKALPLIHSIDLDAIEAGSDGVDALLDPIVTGVPTISVAVTPRVPVDLQSTTEETQYVYAIDATDGSVLVAEHDRVLNIDDAPGVRADRIRLPGLSGVVPSAAALEVLTPLFDTQAPAAQYVRGDIAPDTESDTDLYCTDGFVHEQQTAARLRGVFLAVAMSDGTLRIVDVHDMELGAVDMPDEESPDAMRACRGCPSAAFPLLVRNHARLAVDFAGTSEENPPTLTPVTTDLRFQVDGEPFPLRPNGTSGAPKAPKLACISCPDGYAQSFPDPRELYAEDDAGVGMEENCGTGETGPALLCGVLDPWNGIEDHFVASYEGVIKGATGGDGQFIPTTRSASGVLEFEANSDFCALGVLGRDDIGSAYEGLQCDEDVPLENPSVLRQCADPAVPGDQLVITSELLGTAGLTADSDTLERCAALREEMAADPENRLSIAFEIRRSYANRLVLSECMVNPIGSARFFDEVAPCLGSAPLSYVIRTRDAFAVTGFQNGFQHRVQRNEADRCVVDPAADPLLRGRARLGCTFQNHSIAFHISPPDPTSIHKVPTGVDLAVRMLTPGQKLLFNVSRSGFFPASVVTEQLQYNAVDRRLYLLDAADRGLVPISLDPFPFVDSRDQYN